MRYNYYVAILHNDNTLKYVTKVDNASKMYFCENGKPALKMTSFKAEDLMTCMVANLRNAVVIKTPDYFIPYNNEVQK